MLLFNNFAMFEDGTIRKIDNKEEHDKFLVSRAGYRYWYDKIEIIDVFTIEEFRGHGYAGEVITWLLEYLKEKYPEKEIFLKVLETNINAIKLYKRLGFVVTNKFVDGIEEQTILTMEIKG
jgi:RimJ/RimL family protein N-acetyltransferase